MKHLTLVRHAKSSWKYPELDDFDRPLNSRGKHDAPMMGKKLAEMKVLPDLMISSPAKRAIKTARMIADEIGFPKSQIEQNNKIYANGSKALVETIRRIDDKFEHAMLFGHNPGITDFSYFLTSKEVGNIPTCGVVMIELAADSWKEVTQGIGKLLSFDYPKKYY